jgi:hypothetical protein
MRRLHTADWRSRTATARLPGVLARTLPDAKAFAMRVLGHHPTNFAEHRDLNLREPSFCGLRALSILWRALASVRTSKKLCVGVRSPLLDDGPTVPGNAVRFFGI